MTRVTTKQTACLEAIIACEGRMMDVATRLGVHPTSVSNMVGELNRKYGFPPLTNRGQSQDGRAARVARAVDLINAMGRIPSPVPNPRHPAICHPDREEYAARQCAECYHDRVRRSIAGSVAKAVEPRVLTPKQIEIERQLRGDDVMITWEQADKLRETLSSARDAIDASLKALDKSMARAS